MRCWPAFRSSPGSWPGNRALKVAQEIRTQARGILRRRNPFFFAHLPTLFFDLPGSGLEEPQGNPFGVGVQPRHRPPQGQRFIMLQPQTFGHHRRPKCQHRRPIHHHPSSIPIILGHGFIPSKDQKSCAKTCSLFPRLFAITSKFTLNQLAGFFDRFLCELSEAWVLAKREVCSKEGQKFQFCPFTRADALLGALRIRARPFPANPPPMKPPIFLGLYFLTPKALFRIFNPPNSGLLSIQSINTG